MTDVNFCPGEAGTWVDMNIASIVYEWRVCNSHMGVNTAMAKDDVRSRCRLVVTKRVEIIILTKVTIILFSNS